MAVKFIIYGLVDPRSGDIRYIGRSASGMNRPRQHLTRSRLAGDTTHKANWIRQVLAAGLRPAIHILEEFSSEGPLSDAECFWIAQAKGLAWPITNATAGGEGCNGVVQSAQTRAKRSAAMKGRNRGPSPLRGRALSEEQKALIAAKLVGNKNGLGHTVNPETARKLRGRPRSDEVRATLSAAARSMSKENREKIARARWGDR